MEQLFGVDLLQHLPTPGVLCVRVYVLTYRFLIGMRMSGALVKVESKDHGSAKIDDFSADNKVQEVALTGGKDNVRHSLSVRVELKCIQTSA